MVYYPYMPSIISKRRGARTYYYLVESARVDGKPRIVSQQYLGSAEEVMEKLSGESAGAPVRSQHKEFGALAAVWSVLERLGVAAVVDQAAPRRADAGPRSTKVPVTAVDHRRFWEAMDLLEEESLAEIETELGRRVVTEFGLDLSGLILDMTNFATFIDSGNDKAPLAQRGKAKQKRVDLRLIGLAMVVTRDGGVPVLSRAYPGDRPDVTQFTGVIDELLDRYRALTHSVEALTVVYDAGQNSAANHERVEEAGIGFVGSLPPSDHPDLLALPRSRYRPVEEDRFPGLTCVDTTVTALGVTRRAVLTHSPTLHAAQHRGFDQTLAKARAKLAALQARLARGRTRKSREAVEAEIATIVRPRWVSEVITTILTGTAPADLRLSWRTDQTARRRLEKRIFGKRVLFTNRDAWATAEVVAAYRSQAEVESGFRQLKDPHVVSFSPMHHWTDSKIRVHVFYCVLALTIAHLMRREAAGAGLDLSVRALISELAGIQETVLLYHDGGKGRPRAQRMLTDMNDTQRQLAELFEINRYAPTR
jgi:transposase